MSVRVNDWNDANEQEAWERIEGAAFEDDAPTLGGVLSMACEWRRGSAWRQVLCDVGTGLLLGLMVWGAMDLCLYVAAMWRGVR